MLRTLTARHPSYLQYTLLCSSTITAPACNSKRKLLLLGRCSHSTVSDLPNAKTPSRPSIKITTRSTSTRKDTEREGIESQKRSKRTHDIPLKGYNTLEKTNHRYRPPPEDTPAKTLALATAGRESVGRDNAVTKKSFQKNMPNNFRTIPDTERIEGLEKKAVRVLFSSRTGPRSLSNEAFSIKASRMPFHEPPPPQIPLFVQKAQAEYDQALQQYNQQQKSLQQQQESQKDIKKLPDSTSSSSSPSSSPPAIELLLPMPRPSPFILQYQRRNLRQYPPSPSDPHPAYRVTFVVSKKQISKLAVHRNFARKKLAAAVETVFREHARPGFEYMIFAKRDCVTTLQHRLVELMRKEVSNPKLYGEKPLTRSSMQRRKSNKDLQEANKWKQTSFNQQDSHQTVEDETAIIVQDPAIKIRWKNNNPPLYQKWWKHALPNPLGRIQQSNAYLNMFCKEAQEALAPIREQKGRVQKMKRIRKIQEATKVIAKETIVNDKSL